MKQIFRLIKKDEFMKGIPNENMVEMDLEEHFSLKTNIPVGVEIHTQFNGRELMLVPFDAIKKMIVDTDDKYVLIDTDKDNEIILN